MRLTKNGFFNLIMQEVDSIKINSLDVEQMKFKLSSLPANVIRRADKFEKK